MRVAPGAAIASRTPATLWLPNPIVANFTVYMKR